MTLANPT